MCNVFKSLVFIALSICIAGCSGKNNRGEEADRLLEEAAEYKADHDYAAVMQTLDTLDIKYRDCLEQRRAGTLLRVETLLELTVDSIEADESRRGALKSSLDSLSSMFISVSLPGTNGYKVAKALFSGHDMDATFVQPRIDENGYLCVVANLTGRKIKLNSILCGDAEARGSSLSMEGSELMSVPQEYAAPLMDAVYNTKAGPVTLYLAGSGGKIPVKLTAKQAAAWRDTWRYVKLEQMMKLANVRREKYEYQLDKLRNQLDSLSAAE